MEGQKSWQLEQPQGTPLYTVDAHSTQGMYVKRMLLINRRNLWQLAAAVALLLLYANSLSVLGFVLGILSIPFVFTMTRAVAVFAYKTTQSARGKLIHYTFYEDCFTVQSSYSQSTIWYDDLYRVIVRKDSVCLMVSSLAGFALCENECPENVLDFLRERCAEKRKPKVKETLFTVLFALFCVLFLGYACMAVLARRSIPAETAPAPTPLPAVTAAPTEEPAPTAAPTAEPDTEETISKDPISTGYDVIYETYLKETSTTYEFKLTAKGEDYIILNDTDDAVEFLQYDRDSANGSCALYVYERCPKDANGGWSRQETQILNIYAYHYWDGATAASGKTGWGDAPTKEYSELTGE